MSTAWYVDDDQEMVQAVSLMLKLLGYQVRSFLSARDAARILQYGQKPDLIILDINMPEVSGLDLLEFIRRRSVWENIPIVMLSTEFADTQIDRAMSLGANAYITKPVMVDELELAVKKAMQNVTQKK